MARKRTQPVPLALASDGSVLLNACARLDPATVSGIAEALAVHPEHLFIGTVLPGAQRTQALRRLDDAAAEIAARFQAVALLLPGRSSKKRRLRR